MRTLLKTAVALTFIGFLTGGLWLWIQIREALPVLTGERLVPGLASPVTVERDALGVPRIRAHDRFDAARALGFLHAQDRFFEMDLSRRRAAGELSELFGRATLSLDREVRGHEFRNRAQQVLARLPFDQRRLIDAYTGGVNAGLRALAGEPFEYRLLRLRPEAWQPEDVVLTMYAIALDLQDSTGAYEYALGAIRDRLGPDGLAFLASPGSKWDAPLDGSTLPTTVLPAAGDGDIWPQTPRGRSVSNGGPAADSSDLTAAAYVGSNSFALAASHTANGKPLIAGDMHLKLRVPNIWYRAEVTWPESDGSERRLIGVTLPGVPILISGSNGSVCWVFTNSCVDTADLVEIDTAPSDPMLYSSGPKRSERLQERVGTIRVRGGAPVSVKTLWSRWGPIIGRYGQSRLLALRWTLDDLDAVDMNLWRMEEARSAAEGIALAKDCGNTPLSIIVADRAGGLGWTTCGRIPKRIGWDGRLPCSWAAGDRRWDGYLRPEEIPDLLNPPSGRLWTANNRLIGGAGYARLGDGRYDPGARASQIRDDLRGLEHAVPADMLAIQLDDRALFLGRWQALLLRTLTPGAVAARSGRADLRRYVEQWGGRAAVDSVGYNLVRAWRMRVAQLVFGPVFALCRQNAPEFKPSRIELEDPLWAVLQSRPGYLLNRRFRSWDELMLRAVDDAGEQCTRNRRLLTWGQENGAAIDHPISRGLPGWLGRWLDMPHDALPGDINMPRVQGPTMGASDRMVVSPGDEGAGIFEMPGGQCGNPFSPFYRSEFRAWADGRPTPLLPGPVKYTLTLAPRT